MLHLICQNIFSKQISYFTNWSLVAILYDGGLRAKLCTASPVLEVKLPMYSMCPKMSKIKFSALEDI